jgi:hypothetical protein
MIVTIAIPRRMVLEKGNDMDISDLVKDDCRGTGITGMDGFMDQKSTYSSSTSRN